MKRTVWITLLVFAIALCLSACGGCRHEWQAATCVAPKTCTLCAQTEGEPLPHESGQWTMSFMDYVHAENHLVRKCTVCNTVLEEYTSAMDRLHNGTGFVLSAEEYTSRVTELMEPLQADYGEYTAELVDNDGEAQLVINCISGGQVEKAAELYFAIGGDTLAYDRKDMQNRFLAVGGILDVDHLNVLMPAVIQAADPTMDVLTAINHANGWLSERVLEANGLSYEIAAMSDAAILFMIRVV